MNAIALTFQNTQFDVVDQLGQPWLRGLQIASALGYKNPASDIANLYDRNADEFTDSMTAWVELDTDGGKQKVRIFSLRGCHLLGMLSRTKVAKEFRKWVLDVLEKHTQPHYGLLDLPEPPTLTKSQVGILFNRVNGICAGSGKIRAELWSRFQNHFKLASYKDLPADRYDDAMAYLDAKETEYLGGQVNMLYLSSVELEAKVQERIKAKQGELLEKATPAPTQNSLTISLAPLPRNQFKRWMITQHGDMMQLWAVNADNVDPLINEVVRHGYLVIKKDEIVQKLQA